MNLTTEQKLELLEMGNNSGWFFFKHDDKYFIKKDAVPLDGSVSVMIEMASKDACFDFIADAVGFQHQVVESEQVVEPNYIQLNIIAMVDMGFGPQMLEAGSINVDSNLMCVDEYQQNIMKQADKQAAAVLKIDHPDVVWDDIKKQVKLRP